MPSSHAAVTVCVGHPVNTSIVKTNEFEFAETVNALSQVIGIAIASGSPDTQRAFVAAMRNLIAGSEPHSVRWCLYRQVLRDVTGEIEAQPDF